MTTLNHPYRLYRNADLSGATSVNFHRAGFEPDSIERLLLGIAQASRLVQLNLSQIKLFKLFREFSEHCRKHGSLNNIRRANFSNNGLNGKQCAELMRLLPNLQNLNISANCLYDEGLQRLLPELSKQPLRTLKLQDNGLTDQGAKILLEYLEENFTLTSVCLERNSISEAYLKKIKAQLSVNQQFYAFRMALNTFDSDQLEKCLSVPEMANLFIYRHGLLTVSYLLKKTATNPGRARNAYLCLKQLLAKKIPLYQRSPEGKIFSILDVAKKYSAPDEMTALINETINRYFLQAAKSGNLIQLRRLLECGASPYAFYSKTRENSLHLAVSAQDKKMIIFLVRSYPSLLQQKDVQHRFPQDRGFAELIDGCLHRKDVSVQVSDLTVTYQGKKPYKDVTVDAPSIHHCLKLRHAEERKKIVGSSSTFETLNLVTVGISFVTSDRPHCPKGSHARSGLSFPVLPAKQPTIGHVESFYLFEQRQNAPKSAGLFQDVVKTSPVSKHAEVKAHYSSQSFHRRYHHAERALYKHLLQPEIILTIVDELVQKTKSQKGIKVYAIILHIHSDFSLCESCERSLPYQYGPYGQWQKALIATLKEGSFVVLTKSERVASMVTFSFDKIAKNSRPFVKTETDKSLELNHHDKAKRLVVASQGYPTISKVPETIFSNFSAKKRGSRSSNIRSRASVSYQ